MAASSLCLPLDTLSSSWHCANLLAVCHHHDTVPILMALCHTHYTLSSLWDGTIHLAQCHTHDTVSSSMHFAILVTLSQHYGTEHSPSTVPFSWHCDFLLALYHTDQTVRPLATVPSSWHCTVCNPLGNALLSWYYPILMALWNPSINLQLQRHIMPF
jgi:hypothetical protein